MYDPQNHHRRSVRLKEYDYSKGGAYFVTVCVNEGDWLFGSFKSREVILNDFGRIVESVCLGLPNHYANVILDEYIIMPNHFHGIIFLKQIEEWEEDLKDKNLVGAGLKPAHWSDENDSFKSENTLDAEKRAAFKAAPTEKGDKSHGLPEIIRAFKGFSTREINKLRNTKGTPVWQRNYYEHIIRSETSLADIRRYIQENPLRWLLKHQKKNETI